MRDGVSHDYLLRGFFPLMFVFPANDEAYRKRKRVHKACEQCKRRRKRCDFPMGSVRCEPCEKADILCSLAPDYELSEKEVRLDSLAMRSIAARDAIINGNGNQSGLSSSMNAEMQSASISQPNLLETTNNAGQQVSSMFASASPSSTIPQRPGYSRSSSASEMVPDAKSRKTKTSYGAWGKHGEDEERGKRGEILGSSTARSESVGGPRVRPRLGPRATSYTHAIPSSDRHSPNGLGLSHHEIKVGVNNREKATPHGQHRRTGSHSPGLSKASQPKRAPFRPLESLFVGKLPAAQEPGEAVDRENIGVWVKGVTAQQQLDPYLHTYLSSINAFSMPLRPDREALIQLYYESIDKLLPLVDMNEFIKLHRIGQAPTLLLHAVLLASARHPRARPHLGHQSTRQFCASTAAKIRALLFAEVEQDRLTLVRVYALLSLHSEGPDGLENGCADLERAFHYAISLGLHHERPFVDKEQLKQLFWSLWCMDRINACVNARPLIINIEDVGIETIEPEEHFQLARLIQACWKLEKVIYLYRPTSQGSYCPPVPPEVDELFMGDDTVDPLNAVHALLHHTAFILAHKRVPESQEEETVVSEMTRMTAPTVDSGNGSGSSSIGSGDNNSSDGISSNNRNLKNNTSKRRDFGSSMTLNGRRITGNRTRGTLHTPLTMILAEEKLKHRDTSSTPQSPSVNTNSTESKLKLSSNGNDDDALMEEFFSMDNSNDFGAGNGQEDPLVTPISRNFGNEQNQNGSGNSRNLIDNDTLLLSAAGSVLRIITNSRDIAPLPLVPYSVSLTLTVFLRMFPKYDSETGFGWRDSCVALEAMADRWWVAGAMGSMGWNVFRSIDEAAIDSIANSNNKKRGSTGAETNNEDTTATATQPPNVEELYLSMFSEMPNQTSFIDQALTLDGFDDVDKWLEEKLDVMEQGS